LPSPDCGTPPRIYQEAPAGLPGVEDAARPEGPAGESVPASATRQDLQGMVGPPPEEVGQLRGAGGASGHQQPAGFLDALADPFGYATREIVMLPLVAEGPRHAAVVVVDQVDGLAGHGFQHPHGAVVGAQAL